MPYKQDTLKFARRMIETIQEQDPLLTDWETKFIASLDQQVTLKEALGGDLSRAQMEALERIYADKTK